MTQCVDIKTREGGRTRPLGSFFCRGIWRRLLGIYLFSKYVSSYLFVFGHKNSISPSNNNHNNYSRGWGGENVALGPCLRLRFAFVLTQLDSTWLGLAGMDVVAAVVVLLSRAPMNFLPGCTSNEGLWSYPWYRAPPAPLSPRSFSKFNCARNLSFC